MHLHVEYVEGSMVNPQFGHESEYLFVVLSSAASVLLSGLCFDEEMESVAAQGMLQH
jgi:hypothetical protein